MTSEKPTDRAEEERLLMEMSNFVQCPSEEQKRKLMAWAEQKRREWDARYASMSEKQEIVTVPGDTLIGGQVAVESMLALSKHSPKRLLSPLLDELPLLKLNIAHFLESIVIHERIFFVSPQADFESYLAQAELETMRDFLKPLPPESVVTRLKKFEDPIVPTLILNFEYTYGKLIESPSTTVDGAMLELFNDVFRSFAPRKCLHEIVPMDLHSISHFGLQFWHSWACEVFELTSSDFLEGIPSETGYQRYAGQILSETMGAAEERIQQANEWLGQEYFGIGAPLIFNYIVEKASNRRDILSAAIEIRNSKEATAFRNQCSTFDQALEEGNDRVIIEMISEIKDKIEQLRKRVSGPRLNIDISFPPSITLNPVELWQAIRTRRKRHLNFMSHLYEAAITSRDAWVRFSQML